MATRAERMQQRMRGTGLGQVQGDDVSFQIELGGGDDTTTDDGSSILDANTPIPEPVRTPENYSTRLVNAPQEPTTAIRISDAAPEQSLSSGRPDPYDLLEAAAEEAATPVPGRLPRASLSGLGQESEDLLRLSATARDALGSARSMLSHRTAMTEEVGESPVKAPGTGQRRSIRSSHVSSSSARLQQVISSVTGEDVDPLSSPLEQRTSRIRLSKGRLRDRSLPPEAEEPDELSPEQTLRTSRYQKQGSPDLSSPQKPTTPTPDPEHAASPAQDDNINGAVESSPVEVAKKRRGRKPRVPVEAPEVPGNVSNAQDAPTEDPSTSADRNQTSQPKKRRGRKRRSPGTAVEDTVEASMLAKAQAEEVAEVAPAPVEQDEVSSMSKRGSGRERRIPPAPRPIEEPFEEQAEEPAEQSIEETPGAVEPEEESVEPTLRRRRKPHKASPAKQKQGRRKPADEPPASQEAVAKSVKKRQGKRAPGDEESDLVVFTQRYAKRRRISGEDREEFNILTADIPYANRPGVNCIDVLSSMFSEVIETAVNKLEDSRTRVSDAAAKREVKVKTRALEAFQAELRLHFLEHTINVDHVHALRQRIRQEKREKADLRDEILRLRAEREQIAIRKDSIRARHEKRREETMGQLDLSSALHDVELAIERGRSAPDLSPAQEKEADLVNLDLLVARLSEQGSTKSDTGGTLRQLKEFNAFLERAAVAMEGR